MRLALIFPGYGAQSVGMGRVLRRRFRIVREVYDEADEVLSMSLSMTSAEGPQEALDETPVAYSALITFGAACFRVLRELGVEPVAVAGHSVGQYAALVASGAMEFAEVLTLVRNYGERVDRQVKRRGGRMVLLYGLPMEEVGNLCADVTGLVDVSVVNAPRLVAVSGEDGAVAELVRKAEDLGCRCVPLSVPFAAHCSLMSPIAFFLKHEFESRHVRSPGIPMISNTSGAVLRRADAVRDDLVEQATAPVRWDLSMKTLSNIGVSAVCNSGPGRTLSALARRNIPSVWRFSAEELLIQDSVDIADLQCNRERRGCSSAWRAHHER